MPRKTLREQLEEMEAELAEALREAEGLRGRLDQEREWSSKYRNDLSERRGEIKKLRMELQGARGVTIEGADRQVLTYSSDDPVYYPDAADRIVTCDKTVLGLLEDIRKVAGEGDGVLIRGEMGTGKELVARALHYYSFRQGNFLALNCASFPSTMIEAELFGHERGAYTGSHGLKHGLLETAEGGTLFLDEIGDYPLEVQIRLLRVIETKSMRRIMGRKDVPINTRLVYATNQDLEELMGK